MAFPLGAIGGSLVASAGGSLLGGLFGGNDVPTYEPSPLMRSLEKYGEQQIKPTKRQKQAIRREANTFGSPGAKEAFLQSYVGRFSTPFIEKQLAKSYKTPIDFEGGPYRDVASYAYGQQGLTMPEDAFQQYINLAKATNVRSPEAFSDIVRSGMIASDMVKTPADIAWEQQYGNMPRDPGTGRLIKGMGRFDASRVKELADAMMGQA
jgi:hypothetical protein